MCQNFPNNNHATALEVVLTLKVKKKHAAFNNLVLAPVECQTEFQALERIKGLSRAANLAGSQREDFPILQLWWFLFMSGLVPNCSSVHVAKQQVTRLSCTSHRLFSQALFTDQCRFTYFSNGQLHLWTSKSTSDDEPSLHPLESPGCPA